MLLHGFASRREFWQPTAAAVCRDNNQALVIAPDVHGYGESYFAAAPTPLQASPATITHTAIALLHLLGLGGVPTVLVGHSMSGFGLLSFGDADLGPQVTRIALNPIVPSHSAITRWILRGFALLEVGLGLSAPLRRVVARWLGPYFSVAKRLTQEIQEAGLEEALRMPAPVAARLLAALALARPATTRQSRLSILSSVNDPLCRRVTLVRTSRAIGLEPAQIRWLATGGHPPHLEAAEHPEWTARNLADIVHEISSMLATARDPATRAAITAPISPAETTVLQRPLG